MQFCNALNLVVDIWPYVGACVYVFVCMLASAGVINPLSYCIHAVLQCIYATEYHHLQPSDSFVQPAADFLDQLANRLTDDDVLQLKGQTQPNVKSSHYSLIQESL